MYIMPVFLFFKHFIIYINFPCEERMFDENPIRSFVEQLIETTSKASLSESALADELRALGLKLVGLKA